MLGTIVELTEVAAPGPFNSNIKFVIKQVFAIFACQKLA
jgi:hypothetical protein